MEKKAGAVTGVQRKAADLLKALLCAYSTSSSIPVMI